MIDCMVEHLTKKSVKNVYVQKGCIKTLEPNDLRENLSCYQKQILNMLLAKI